jgi:hypothetical protein
MEGDKWFGLAIIFKEIIFILIKEIVLLDLMLGNIIFLTMRKGLLT